MSAHNRGGQSEGFGTASVNLVKNDFGEHHIGAGRIGHGKQRLHGIRQHSVVTVEKINEFTARHCQTLHARLRRPLIHGGSGHNAGITGNIPVYHRACAVGAAVVYQNQFKVGVCLSQNGIERCRKKSLGIINRNYYGYSRRRCIAAH